MAAGLRQRGTRRDRAWQTAQASFRQRAVMYGCVACRLRGQHCDGRLHAHHWLYEQHIRNYVSAYAHEHDLARQEIDELECELTWSHENAGGLCERAHRRHHNRMEPIPLDLVPLRAIVFATGLGLAHRLEACYPAL